MRDTHGKGFREKYLVERATWKPTLLSLKVTIYYPNLKLVSTFFDVESDLDLEGQGKGVDMMIQGLKVALDDLGFPASLGERGEERER